MRRQPDWSSRTVPYIVDQDCELQATFIGRYRGIYEDGLSGQGDPAGLLLSMSEYDKPQPYEEVYEYAQATRPNQAQDYSGFAQQTYAPEYAGIQAQVPSGLPHSTQLSLLPAGQYGTHDASYYAQHPAGYSPFIGSTPRQLPVIDSYTPTQGQTGNKLTVYFRTIYDLEGPSPATILIMFGTKRCDSVLSRTGQHEQHISYALSAESPPFNSTGSLSPQVPLWLIFEDGDSQPWESPSLEFGSYTYLDSASYGGYTSPEIATRKRKLTPDEPGRRSPAKRASTQQLASQARDQGLTYAATPSSAAPDEPFTRPNVSDAYTYTRRFSGPEYQQSYGQTMARAPSQQSYGTPSSAVQYRSSVAQSPSYSYHRQVPTVDRSPSTASVATMGKAQLLPSPASISNPPLIRTSTLPSPTTPGPPTAQAFNPYAIYPSNTKAMLKIEGDLDSMAKNWTAAEWETGRRLVQFRRSQTGSVISASFEPVTLEDRIPNSICVSCIWWQEKQQSYVTSVDTIQLLESLVAVRFTVEEKNRIRRNLEGFHPATVSKTKSDSEDFFKQIMGFPNPKPRNIEKDVKVFPWRVLSLALKKIIGKYSASYSSTAGALHSPAGSSYTTTGRAPEAVDQRIAASPRSTTNSAPPNAYAPVSNLAAYTANASGSAGLGLSVSAGPPDLRLTVPGTGTAQTTSWHQPSAHYSSDPSATGRASWDFGQYFDASPATGLPGSAQSLHYQQRMPSISQPASMAETKFVPLQDYQDYGQRTSRT